MKQQQIKLNIQKRLVYVDYFPNNKTQCFRPHCKPNWQILEQMEIANLHPIDFQQFKELKDYENDTRSKVSDSLEFPYSAIGFLSLNYGKIKYRGSGFLVGPNIVLTAARNLYIHSSKMECKQIKFYPGIHSPNGRQCNVKKWYYPPQYIIGAPEQRGEYDFAILELSDDVGLECGYFGIDFEDRKNKQFQKIVHIYGYPECVFEKQKQLDTRYCMYGDSGKWVRKSENRSKYKIPTSAGQCGSPIFIKESQNSYIVVGIHTDVGIPFNSGVLMSTRIKKRISKFINKHIQEITVWRKEIMQDNGKIKIKKFTQIMRHIQEKQCNRVCLYGNHIGAEGAKFLSQANWPFLTQIKLQYNNIGAEGARFLSLANWPLLAEIDLYGNHIGAEGAKFLSQANWPFLTQINLQCSGIGVKGGKSLSLANWPLLNGINLRNNNIGAEGAKSLSQANWSMLTGINLWNNDIGPEGARFLSLANWPLLTYICLQYNNIGAEGAKFRSHANWPLLTKIDLQHNNIGVKAVKCLY